MKNLMQSMLAAVMAFTLAAGALAQEARKATAEDAVAMVKKATAFLEKNGREKTVAAVNDPKGEFVKGDLYAFVIVAVGDQAGLSLANGGNPKMANKNLLELNAGGVFPVKEFVKVANSPAGKGWVSYKWPNPVTKNLEEKSTYIEKSGDLLVGAGIYK